MAEKGTFHANEDRRNKAQTVDIPFLILILLLLTLGLMMLYSASYAQSEYDTSYEISTKYLQKQAVFAVIGLAAMALFSRIPAALWQKFAWPMYVVSILLLLSVLVMGQEVNGAKRWISIAGIQFQPSEVAKFSMILVFARLTRHFGPDAKRFRYGVVGFGAALMGILVPLALEKHLSAIMLMGLVAVVMMFAIMPIIMSITSREMVFIILIGLAFISMLGNEGRVKSLISGCLGLMLSCIGMVMVSGEVRFTFDQAFLFEGLPIVPVCFGLFAVPPMVELAMKGSEGTISNVTITSLSIKDTLKGAWDVLRNKFLCLRCAIIGYFFGILPGVGANAAVFLAYGHAKATDKKPESFGTGNVRGVIGPESCNNAKESGSWLTTFALGVPGSSTGAIGLGALMMMGIMPGPGMLTEHLDITFSLLMIVALANIVGFIICFPLVAPLARIAAIPSRILVPLVFIFIVVGTYANRSLMEDIVLLLIFSVIGLIVRRFKYNAGSMLLGYILGTMFENYLFISLQIEGITFFMHPIPLLLIGCLVLFLAWPVVQRIVRGGREC